MSLNNFHLPKSLILKKICHFYRLTENKNAFIKEMIRNTEKANKDEYYDLHNFFAQMKQKKTYSMEAPVTKYLERLVTVCKLDTLCSYLADYRLSQFFQ